jgi:hypothetical protein
LVTAARAGPKLVAVREANINFNSETRVKDIAVADPATTKILEQAGVDYCCGGYRSLRDACADAGVPSQELIEQLRAASVQVGPADARSEGLLIRKGFVQETIEAPVVAKAPSAPSLAEVMDAARIREASLSRLLMAYISSGLIFMLLPGTFLGVRNLLQISGRESAAFFSPSWIQAHGHAQVFGWIGSFIFGIGFYSIPKLRGTARAAFGTAWVCWVMWTAGVASRWLANVYGWEWRLLLPISSALELGAFGIFFRAVSQHRSDAAGAIQPDGAVKSRLDSWIWVVISASVGLLLVLMGNVAISSYLALKGTSPALPHVLDQRYLVLVAWGFLVPFVWGFSAKWMGVFLGLKTVRPKLLLSAVAINVAF